MKFKKKMLRTILSAIIAVISVIASFVIYVNYQYVKKVAKTSIIYAAAEYAEKIERYFNEYVILNQTYRDLASNFEQIPQNDRRQYYNQISQLYLEKNTDLLSVWMDFFPNKLDGLDEKYKNDIFYTPLGRYTIGWNRSQGVVERDADGGLEDEDYDADYYIRPVKEKSTAIMYPYLYSYTGSDEDIILMTSISSPIMTNNGEIVGVAGIDISIESIKKVVNNFRPMGAGYAVLISHDGDILSHPDSTYIGQNISKMDGYDNILQKIENGEGYQHDVFSGTTGEESFEIFMPLRIANKQSTMAFAVSVPYSVLFAEGVNNMFVIGIGASMAFIILVVFATIIINNFARYLVLITSSVADLSKCELNIKPLHTNYEEINTISDSVINIQNAMHKILLELDTIIESIKEGELEARLDVEMFDGSIHKSLLDKINKLLDSFSSSLNLLSEYTSQLANGNCIEKEVSIKPKGIFYEIGNDINQISINKNNLLAETDALAENIISGNLEYRSKIDKNKGTDKTIIHNANILCDTFMKPLELANDFTQSMVSGKQIAPIDTNLQGDFVILQNNINRIIEIFNSNLEQIHFLVDSINKGDISVSVLEKEAEGQWKIILAGINHIYLTFVSIIDNILEVTNNINTNCPATPIKNNYEQGKLFDLINNINKLINMVNKYKK